MGVHERIASAISGGVLGSEGTTDTLGAMGFASSPADALFWRKYGSAGSGWDTAARMYVTELAGELADRGRWQWSASKLLGMANTVYEYWLTDTCQSCAGRGFVLPEGSPYLSDDHCPACDPDRPGRRPYPWLIRQRVMMRRLVGRPDAKRQAAEVEAVGARHKQLLCRIELVEANAGERVIARLANAAA